VRRLSSLAFCTLVLLVGLSAPASAQPPCKSTRTYRDHSFGTVDCNGKFTPDRKPAFSQSDAAASAAKSTPSAALSEDPYSLWYDGYVKRIYEWQFYSGIALFTVVIALVGAALYFAYVQFRFSLRASSMDPQTIQIDTHGLAIKSSFLGVVILAFSLAFFFLYLRYVYPITETPSVSATASTPNPE
jgi:hypothetical protein